MKINVSLGRRIWIGFILLIGLVLIASWLGLLLTRSVGSIIDTTQAGSEQIQAIRDLEQGWSNVAATIDRLLLTHQTNLIDQDLPENRAIFNQELDDLANLQETSLEAAAEIDSVTANLLTASSDMNELVDELIVLAQDGRWVQAQTLRYVELSSAQHRFDENLELLSGVVKTDVSDSVAENIALQNQLLTFWAIGASVAILGGLVIGFITVRSITIPIQQLTGQIQQVTQRDFANITPLKRNDELGRLSQAFAQMASWLRESYDELEKRVAQRTQALQASNEVSRSLSTILDPDKLVKEVVEQVKQTFDYYHVHIYLFDKAQNKLVMVGGTGEAGAAMLAANHALAMNQGLVGQAANNRQVTLVPDVSQASTWLANPLLPETQAEIAVPILLADEMLGVLDVQHNVANGLTEMDTELLQNIANQVAVAVQNARSYQQVKSQQKYESLAGEIGQKIQLASSVEDVLKVAVRELAAALEVPKIEISLQNSQKDNGYRAN